MDYISVNEFKKQSDKVRKVLLDWWRKNVERYDMFYRKSKVGFDWSGRQKYIITKVKGYELETITLRNREISAGRDAWTEKWNIQYIWDIIPLLTETQLRKFIEEKTGYKVKIEIVSETDFDAYKVMAGVGNKSFMALGEDLLQTYWQVVCKIAESEENNND